METIHTFYKSFLPTYLKSLRIPKTIAGLTRLSVNDWLTLSPVIIISILMVYTFINIVCFNRRRRRASMAPKVNLSVQKEDKKVVTQMDIEDIGDKIAFCRCWRSKKFPLCDGSHNQHNAETRDNVGPLLLRRAELEQ